MISIIKCVFIHKYSIIKINNKKIYNSTLYKANNSMGSL